MSNVTVKINLFTCSNERYAFLSAVETVLKHSPNFKCGVNQLCLEGHSNFSLIIQSAFNYFAKNDELKRLNALKLENLGLMV